MIELVFVIVILGILSAVAIPKMAANRTDAYITRARADIATIRSSIVSERQTRLIKGDSSYIYGLSLGSDRLFEGNDSDHTLLPYGIAPSPNGNSDNGYWHTTDNAKPYNKYIYRILDTDISFEYNASNGKFNCDTSVSLCKKLVD